MSSPETNRARAEYQLSSIVFCSKSMRLVIKFQDAGYYEEYQSHWWIRGRGTWRRSNGFAWGSHNVFKQNTNRGTRGNLGMAATKHSKDCTTPEEPRYFLGHT